MESQTSTTTVEWTWRREALQKVQRIIVPYCMRNIIEEIREGLKLVGEGVYLEFLNSCFGSLMHFDTQGSTCYPSLHWLFAQEVVKADAAPDELWYRVGGRFIRFSKYEYALVTGLSFGPTSFDPSANHDPPKSGLFSEHYGGRRLKMNTLRDHFIAGNFRESPANALKVAKLLFVYYFLLGLSGSKTYIDEWAWTLIEDTNGWETFDWGKYSYHILLGHLQRLPTDPTRVAHHVCGFVYAFWLWAFEAIPALGIACNVLASKDVLPRCLRWKFPKTNEAEVKGIFDGQLEVYSMLEPSAEEQRQPYWEHIIKDLGPEHQENRMKKKTTPNVLRVDEETRTDPLTTRGSPNLSEHECGYECGCQDEMTSIIQPEFFAQGNSLSTSYTLDNSLFGGVSSFGRIDGPGIQSECLIQEHVSGAHASIGTQLMSGEGRDCKIVHSSSTAARDEMLSNFQNNDELCMKAVCDLHRHQSQLKGLSMNRGFPVDPTSGFALAEYLIDGDKKLRLRKSVCEVKNERPDVIDKCRKLATFYIDKLYDIHCAANDLSANHN